VKLQLSIGFAANPRTWPILDGRVPVDGVELVPSVVAASELFWRQLRFADFDVSEMSISSFMIARSQGDDRWVGLPIFTTKRFFHTELLVRKDAGIHAPADLAGKRVGVLEYQQTAALWVRGALEHEFGVRAQDMEFWMERTPAHSHGGATGFVPPPGVTIHQIPVEQNVGTMMLSGELDAALFYHTAPTLVHRSAVELHGHPAIETLFPDPYAEGVRYFRKTGIFPINHAMVIRRELAEKHPWLILNILKAFDRANAIADAERMEHVEYHLAAGLLPPEAKHELAVPLLRHGIAANRTVLEAAAQYSHEQGLTPRRMTLPELFAASTLDQ
jgi:4,5-dihydroxyphthalate decarboxylase